MFGENTFKNIPFGKKKPEVAPVEIELVVANETESLAQVFDGLKDESLKNSINQHAISLISGEAQDYVVRNNLEAQAQAAGIDAETLGKLIELQKNRLNPE